MSAFSSIEDALREIGKGRMVIVVDDEDRENEGDIIMAAEFATAESVNFIARHARGLICAALEGERLDELHLGPMVQENTAKLQTHFTVSVDAVHGTTTGISAYDRAATIKTLIDPATRIPPSAVASTASDRRAPGPAITWSVSRRRPPSSARWRASARPCSSAATREPEARPW